MRFLCTTIIAMNLSALAAEKPIAPTEIRFDANSPDIIGQFHQIGLPKYTDVEKQIIARAQTMQEKHTAVYQRIAVGKSVSDYPGLIALGTTNYDPALKRAYILTIGIRPHLPEFANSFCEYHIGIDEKGIIQSKTKVPYSPK